MLIIDGSHLLHRIKFASPENYIPNWQYYSYSFLTSALSSMKKFKDKDIVVAWDEHGSYRRKRFYEDYKKRDPIDSSTDEGKLEELALKAYVDARNWLHDNAKLFGFCSIKLRGIEADDIAYVLTHAEELKNEKGHLITEDRDWIQSLTPNFKLWKPIQQVLIEYNELIDNYSFVEDFTPTQMFSIMKSIEGDGADNISGVYGIGNSYGRKFLSQYFNDKDDDFKGKKGEQFKDGLQIIADNFQLINFEFIRESEKLRTMQAFISNIGNCQNSLDIISCIDLAKALASENALNFYKYYEF